jgi:hypothetical protein
MHERCIQVHSANVSLERDGTGSGRPELIAVHLAPETGARAP